MDSAINDPSINEHSSLRSPVLTRLMSIAVFIHVPIDEWGEEVRGWLDSLFSFSRSIVSLFFILLQGNMTLNQKHHTCQSNEEKNIVDKALADLKETVTTSNRPVPRLYNEAMVELQDAGLNFVADIPSLSNTQHCLYTIRNKAMHVSKTIYKCLKEVEIPEKFSSFVLADYSDEGSRILVFCSLTARDSVSNIKEYFMDGTFKSCPKPFAQLYTLLGDVGSSMETTKVVPLIFALLPDKTEKTYFILFSLIRSQLSHWKPAIVHCDYEIAAINAMSELFPETQIKGCFYHWCRAVWRKAKYLQLTKTKAQKRIVSLTAALALLPQMFVTEGWNYIKSQSETTDMSKFINYIDRFWLKKNIAQILSVFALRHRTNNAIEGWHSKLNRSVNKNTVTLHRLLSILHNFDLEANLRHKIKNKKRSEVLIKNDEFIMVVLMELINSEISVGHALDKLR